MGLRKRSDDGEIDSPERERLADELAGLKAEVKALREERDATKEAARLRKDIESLKVEKSRLAEDNARKIREVEHKTGLMRTRQEHEVENAKRQTELDVREQGLKADKKRFEDEMKFQRERLQGEVDRVSLTLDKILERLPVIEVSLDGPAATRKPAAARKGD